MKLVRDKIPTRIMAEGTPIRVSRAKYEDMPTLLLKKLREETVELAEALERDESDLVLTELVDCFEVLRAIAEAHEVTEDELIEAATEKREDSGGFSERYVVHGTLKQKAAVPAEPTVAEARELQPAGAEE